MTEAKGITTSTLLFGLIGDPIAHSKSPLMQNCAFAAAGLNAAYMAFHVKPENLKHAIAGIRALGIRGVNVTIPHKVEVMSYLDEIDESARMIGAVNTIVNEQGRLIGYNTDGIGYVRSLKEESGIQLQGKHVLLLGAGGAARGIAYALLQEGIGSLSIVNRTPERAVALAADLDGFGGAIEGHSQAALSSLAPQADIIINTTQMGMHPDVEGTPLDHSLFQRHHLVSDIIYNPLETRFLREARLSGASTHSGLGMFIYQGAYAFEYWTHQAAPTAEMFSIVRQSFS